MERKVPCPTATLPRSGVATYLLLLETLLLLVVGQRGLWCCCCCCCVQFASVAVTVAIRERNFRHFQVIGVAFILIIFTCCHEVVNKRGRKREKEGKIVSRECGEGGGRVRRERRG